MVRLPGLCHPQRRYHIVRPVECRRPDSKGTTLPERQFCRRLPGSISLPEIALNDEAFNLSIRKFLKMVGVNSQREIEQAATKAIAAGTLKGNTRLPATMTLEVPGLQLSVKFDGEVSLD